MRARVIYTGTTSMHIAVDVRSADPRDHAAIHQNFLAEPKDWDTLRKGIEMMRDLVAQKPLDRFRRSEIQPGASAKSRTLSPRPTRAPIPTMAMGSSRATCGDALARAGLDAASLIPAVEGKVMSAFVRARKPAS